MMEIRWRKSVVFTMFTVFMMILCGITGTVSGSDLGYVGCYPAGFYLQAVFPDESYSSSTIDDCLLHCRNDLKAYAAISRQTCFCSGRLPESEQKVNDDHCNLTCSGDSQQICGGRAHYAMFSTTTGICSPLRAPVNGRISRVLFRVGRNVTFGCVPGYDLIGPTMIQCLQSEEGGGKTVWTGDVPLCEPTANEETGNETSKFWLHVLIDVVVIVLGSSLVILAFFAIRSCRRRDKKVRSLTSREDFSIPDCAMVETLDKGRSPNILSSSYRNFSMSSLERDSELPTGSNHQIPDSSHSNTTSTAMTKSDPEVVDTKPRKSYIKRRKKSRGADSLGSSQNKGSTLKDSSETDHTGPSTSFRSKTGLPSLPGISSNKSPKVPEKPKSAAPPLNPSVEYASVNKPRCKSAYIPKLQNVKNNPMSNANPNKEKYSLNQEYTEAAPVMKQQPILQKDKSGIYISTVPIASRWHVKNSIKVNQEGYAVMDGTNPETDPRSKPGVLPKTKLPKDRDRNCYSMQILD